MAKLIYLIAALLSLFIAGTYFFLGGSIVIPPLLASKDIPEVAAWFAYFCWHVGTVAVIVYSAAFVWVGPNPRNRVLGVAASTILTGFGLLGLGMALFGNDDLWGTPALYAFGVIGLIGFVGTLLDRRSELSRNLKYSIET